MGGAHPFVEPPHLFHTWRDNHSVELFQVLLLFADFHHLARHNVHLPEQLARPQMGYHRRCFGQRWVLFGVFRLAFGFHQVENRRDATVEETNPRGGDSVGFVRAQLAVDERINTIICQSFENPIFGLAINAALKSALFLALGMVVLYKLKVSQSLNDLVDRVNLIWKKA